MSKQIRRGSRAGVLTRQEQREARREERRRAEARARRTRQIRRVVLVGSAALGVALVIFLAIRAATGAGDSTTQIAGLMTYGNLVREHKTGSLTYPQTPPVGGPHNPVWQDCAIYSAPMPNENATHSLEHGAKWIAYRPDLPETSVQQLRNLAQGRGYVLLAPYPGLSAPIIASAWGVQLKVRTVSDGRLGEFVRTYEQGPQTPEPGATCSGGTNKTVSQGK